jgi:hypothetical protein
LTIFADALAVLLASPLAEAATYRAQGTGGGVAVSVLRSDVVPETGFGRARSNRQHASFEVLATAVAAPARDDTLTIGAQVWRVADPPTLDPVTGSWTLQCFLEI